MNYRYQNINIKKQDGTKEQYYANNVYPEVPLSPEDTYVIATLGDRLDLLAHQFYRNVKYWWIIAHANNLGKGSLAIPEGSQVRIPADPIKVQRLFDELNKR